MFLYICFLHELISLFSLNSVTNGYISLTNIQPSTFTSTHLLCAYFQFFSPNYRIPYTRMPNHFSVLY